MLFRETNRTTPLGDICQEMDRFFNRFSGGMARTAPCRQGVFPALNVWEDAECYYAEAEIPGVADSALEITVSGDVLTLEGRRTAPEDEGRTYHRRERGVGEFTRTVTLPAEVDADQVEAAIAKGVLTVKLPKAEATKARKIVVNTA
ncbi:MAG: Hsp20/alpha crystallin family protein [bacterium]|nr:Hsp20/alpha crystallin family protein [bacterium]